MQTDQSGNKGHYVSKSTGKPCKSETDGTYDMNNCYFDIDIRSSAAGGFGQKIHTRKQEKGLPDAQHTMWTHYDLQNTCDTNNLKTCGDNTNCDPRLLANEQAKGILKVGQLRTDSKYWSNKWSNDKDVCDWDGVTCGMYDNKKYISGVDINKQYFDPSKVEPKPCHTNDPGMTQNQWVRKQKTQCGLLPENNCNDNKFCSWTASTVKGKTGKCSLDKNYAVMSGLNKDDEFKTKTMFDVLGEINIKNNGRVGDATEISNVVHTRRGDVLMQQDNQETAVKGIVEETALSTIFLSKMNTDIIQQTMRYRVHVKINMVVHQQSPETLYVIMRSILLQYGNFRVGSSDLAGEIRKLNSLVVRYCVKEVSSNVLQYKGYVKDLETLPTPIDRPDFNDHGSRNKTFDLSNVTLGSWGQRHTR